jgi:oligopeptide transport system substrate-binding protein
MVISALAVVAAACGDSGSDSSTSASTTAKSDAAPEGGTFTDGAQLQADNLTSFDPGLVQTLDEAQITYSLYDGLTDFDFSDPTKPVLKGLVAEKWVANSNATEYTFTIKKGLVFSNGDPVLPSSFKYAWVRNGQKSLASPYGYLINFIKGGADLQAGKVTNLDSAIVADDTAMTLKVTLAAPFADFPAAVTHAFFMPLPEQVVSKLTDQTQWDKGLMIGNGPFMQDKPKSSTEISMVRNDKWAGNVLGDKKAKLDKVIFKITKDVESGYTDFEAGNIMSATIPSGKYAEAQAKYGNTTKEPQLGSYHFVFGSSDPTIGGDKNLKLRQAISLAVDRDQINKKVYEGVRTVSTGITPNGIPGFKAGICNYCKFDLPKAKALLAEWQAAGNKLQTITIDYNTAASQADVVAIVQQNLKDLGLDVKTNPVSVKYYGTMAANGCHVCRSGWFADYPTYGNFMLDLFGAASIGGNNLGSFNDPKFEDILAKAQAEVDDAKRATLYQQSEDYLLNTQMAALPLNWYVGDQVYAKNVVGYTEPPLGIILWERVGIKK